MKIFLTGSKGFIGKNFLDHFSNTSVSMTSFDISDNTDLRPKDINLKGFDVVIHLGAISSTTETDIRKLIDLNLSWSLELIDECKKLKNSNLVFQWASSASVYGKSTVPMKESDSCNPLNYYATSKYLLEQAIISSKLDFIWQGFRYFNVYGPYEDHKLNQASPYTQFEKQAKETGIIRVFEGSNLFKRDFICVDRVIDIHKKMMKLNSSGIFNVGTGSSKSFFDIAKDIAQKYNAKIEIIPFPEALKSHYQSFTCADMTLLNNTINDVKIIY